MKTGEEGQIRQSQAEWSYERVKSWTKKVDVFSKRMLVFPICEDEHWYLVIVCNPGLVLSQKRKNNFEKARKEQRESEGSNPFMMILDSLSGTHSTASNKIRSYLQLEHLEKKRYPLTFGKEKMNEKYPKIPLQPNSCDCGLFLLHYLELIFKDPTAFLGASLPDLSKWFTEKEIDYKRYDIAVIIRKLAAKESDVAFPRIMFPAKRRKEEIEVRKRRSEDEKATPGRQKHKATRQPRTPLACDSSNYSSSPSPPPPKKGPQTTGGHRSRRTKESESTSNLLSHFPQFLGGDFDEERRCPAVANSSSTSLRRKFFLSRGVESRGNENDVINSKSEMMEELMKGCR